jgi:hypothetical protein
MGLVGPPASGHLVSPWLRLICSFLSLMRFELLASLEAALWPNREVPHQTC